MLPPLSPARLKDSEIDPEIHRARLIYEIQRLREIIERAMFSDKPWAVLAEEVREILNELRS